MRFEFVQVFWEVFRAEGGHAGVVGGVGLQGQDVDCVFCLRGFGEVGGGGGAYLMGVAGFGVGGFLVRIGGLLFCCCECS